MDAPLEEEHDWIRGLRPSGTIAGISAHSVRERVTALIGASAVAWGVEVGQGMAHHILDAFVDWPGGRSPQEFDMLRRATEATTLDTPAALVSGDPGHMDADHEHEDNIRSFVRQQVPLPDVLRNVQHGQNYITQRLIDAVPGLVEDGTCVASIRAVVRDATALWSEFIRHVGEDYARFRDEWLHSAEGQRVRLVRSLLQNPRVDPTGASRTLGYDLSQEHVAVIMWFEGLDPETVRHLDFAGLARDLATVTRASGHLAVTADGHRCEVWLGSPLRDVVAALCAGSWPAGLRTVVGSPGVGLGGFATTYAEARAAGHLVMAGGMSRTVTSYVDEELLYLLTADRARSRAFVRRTLGPIGGTDARSQDLRATLAAWIDSRGNVAATSQALFVHRNTITYRLRQVEGLLGGELDHTRLRSALLVAEHMPQTLAEPA